MAFCARRNLYVVTVAAHTGRIASARRRRSAWPVKQGKPQASKPVKQEHWKSLKNKIDHLSPSNRHHPQQSILCHLPLRGSRASKSNMRIRRLLTPLSKHQPL
ncbi:hypothetical protein MRX96_054329 [Rhipicephalus microplus]